MAEEHEGGTGGKGSSPLVEEEDSALARASNADSAASMPVFMALCVPLTFGTFMNPALHPIRAPPGNANLGILWGNNTTMLKAVDLVKLL